MNERAMKAACEGYNGIPFERQDETDVALMDNAITAYLSAVWRPFDPDRPETWPATPMAPSGDMWVTMDAEGRIAESTWRGDGWDVHIDDAARYCDPADLYVKE